MKNFGEFFKLNLILLFYSTFLKVTNVESAPEDSIKGKPDVGLQRDFLKVFYKENFHPDAIPEEYQNAAFLKIGPDKIFFDTSPANMQAIKGFKEVLMKQNSTRNVFAAALQFRDVIHRSLWLHGFIGAIMNRGDGLSPFLPLVEVKPDLMISSRAINEATIQARKPPDERTCVVAVDKEAGKVNGKENELWYFREDLMVNSHHWYWHLTYPFTNEDLVDRQGELFYYMHQSILARYHAERLSNNLPPVSHLVIKNNGTIKEHYYSFLGDDNSGLSWEDRHPYTPLKDVQREAFGQFWNITVEQIATARDRLFNAAEKGFMVTPNRNRVDLKNFKGIDILSRTTEAMTNFSINNEFYGNFHNEGHLLIALINDTGVAPGVMGDTATSTRDVVFYRWHTLITNLFTVHKETLEPYSPREGEFQLVWPDVFIEDLVVNTVGRSSFSPTNTLYTFWFERQFDLSKGLDFHRDNYVNGSVDVCVDHLNHDEFEYSITINKNSVLGDNTKATVRIFMAPRFDQNNSRYSMEEQRLLFFVLDTFTVDLKVGLNVIKQRSEDSSLTIEFVKSLAQLENDTLNERPQCGCGWPQHLLLPKGKSSGMIFDLFVMVTNGDDDTVVPESFDDSNKCSQGYLFCGRLHDKYPDSKPMGYPFDRKPYTVPDSRGRRPVANLDEYIKVVPNMKAIQVNIFHESERKEKLKDKKQFETEPLEMRLEISKLKEDFSKLKEDLKIEFKTERLKTSMDILKLKEDLKIEFREMLSEHRNVQENISESGKVVDGENQCGDILESAAGSIVYKHSSNYSNNERCVWIVRIPKTYTQIEFTKRQTQFEIGYDYITIFTFNTEGHNQTLNLGKDSNEVQSGILNGLVAVVMFTSDGSGSGPGFILEFRAMGNSRRNNYENYKDYIFSSPSGKLRYPMESSTYKDYEMSVFVISNGFSRGSSSSNFTIETKKMDLEKCGEDEACTCDRLILYHVERDSLVQRYRFCGHSGGRFISPDLYILVFATDRGDRRSGFELEWSQGNP